MVPLADGSFAPIEHIGVDDSTKTLGSMTCPSGCNNGAKAVAVRQRAAAVVLAAARR